MPWCTGCDRFLSPSTVTTDGRCPRCGAVVDPGAARAPAPSADAAPYPGSTSDPIAAPVSSASSASSGSSGSSGSGDSEEEPFPLPWHFKMLVGAIALYLGWRAFQGVEWLAHRL